VKLLSMEPLPVTDRTRITRLAERQATDRQALYDVLDAGLVAHIGLVRDGLPVVLPVGYARSGDYLLLHGSTGGGLLRAATDGAPLAVTVTLLDGLVYARSLFDSSMNYRSTMICGSAQPLHGQDKIEGLRQLSEHLMPGRWAEVRPPTTRELAATLVLRLPLDEASVKIRASGATTDPQDGEARDVWAGVLPLTVCAGAPAASQDTPGHINPPASVHTARQRHSVGLESP
jgi:nitroimidazol reductase NimA-like FMN-containing flavoprotein (pyridoxamine 5'-phosphate oxidase superfamily)